MQNAIEKQEKKLQTLNDTIRKGRINYASNYALIFTAVLASQQFIFGGFIEWWVQQAWYIFPLLFFAAYMNWMRILRKARKIADALNREVVSPPEKETEAWLITVAMAVVFITPHFFSESIFQLLKQQRVSLVTTLNLNNKEKGDITLHIPSLFFDDQMQSYNNENFQDSERTVYASINDLRPVPKTSPNEMRLVPKEDIMSIQFVNLESNFYRQNYDTIYNDLSPIPPLLINNKTSPILNFSAVPVRALGDKNSEDIPSELSIGVPEAEELKGVFVLCHEPTCTIIASLQSVGAVNITFPARKKAQWLDVYRKANVLVQGFLEPTH